MDFKSLLTKITSIDQKQQITESAVPVTQKKSARSTTMSGKLIESFGLNEEGPAENPQAAGEPQPQSNMSLAPQLPAGGDPGILAMQKELKDAGADLGTFGVNKDGLDGKMGRYTAKALLANPAVASKYPELKAKAEQIAVQKPAAAPASAVAATQAAQSPKVAEQNRQIAILQQQLAAAKTPEQKKGIQAAINRIQATLPGAVPASIPKAMSFKDQIDQLEREKAQKLATTGPGAVQAQADAEYIQQDINRLKAHQSQVKSPTVASSTQNTLSILQQQLAAAKTPEQKKGIQAAINRLTAPQLTQSFEPTGNAIAEDDRIIRLIKYLK